MSNKHPYGVQPWGNYYSSPKESIRRAGLGDLSVCSDELLLKILELLDPKSLAKLSLVSKAFFCFAYFEDFWKSFVLKEYQGNFTYTRRWRCTYVTCSTSLMDICFPFQPLCIDGFYSDMLYQPWLCANIEIPHEWLKVQNIPRIHNLSKHDFRKNFEIPNIPVILTGVVDNWKASHHWNRQFFSKCFKDQKVLVGNYPMKFEDYIQYCDNQEDEMPLYLFDKHILNSCSVLEGYYNVPDPFQEDLFNDLGNDKRPDYKWLIMGPKRSGSSFHKDPNCTSAWNAVIYGSKKWILYPPNALPPGVHESPNQSEVATSISLMEWFLNFYQDTKSSKIKPKECVLKAGEILFVPRGWWHLAMNLKESVAITQNFVSSVNLPNVLQFLRSRNTSLVSGIPIENREFFYDDFVKALEEHHPVELDKALKETTTLKRYPVTDLHPQNKITKTDRSFKFNFF